MSWMKDRGEQTPRRQESGAPSERIGAVANDAADEFAEAFADALRDILQDERPRAA
jgi:hypothetical protein